MQASKVSELTSKNDIQQSSITVQEILQTTEQTEQNILLEHLVLQALAKISRYQAECALLEHKYGCSFEVLQQTAKHEDFSVEDDLLDWEYAHSALQWWQKCLRECQRVA